MADVNILMKTNEGDYGYAYVYEKAEDSEAFAINLYQERIDISKGLSNEISRLDTDNTKMYYDDAPTLKEALDKFYAFWNMDSPKNHQVIVTLEDIDDMNLDSLKIDVPFMFSIG